MTDDMQALYNLKFVALTTTEIVSTSRNLPKFKLTGTELATITGNASTLKKSFMKLCTVYISSYAAKTYQVVLTTQLTIMILDRKGVFQLYPARTS
jgi:hypothetical protein